MRVSHHLMFVVWMQPNRTFSHSPYQPIPTHYTYSNTATPTILRVIAIRTPKPRPRPSFNVKHSPRKRKKNVDRRRKNKVHRRNKCHATAAATPTSKPASQQGHSSTVEERMKRIDELLLEAGMGKEELEKRLALHPCRPDEGALSCESAGGFTKKKECKCDRNKEKSQTKTELDPLKVWADKVGMLFWFHFSIFVQS